MEALNCKSRPQAGPLRPRDISFRRVPDHSSPFAEMNTDVSVYRARSYCHVDPHFPVDRLVHQTITRLSHFVSEAEGQRPAIGVKDSLNAGETYRISGEEYDVQCANLEFHHTRGKLNREGHRHPGVQVDKIFEEDVC